MKNKTKQNLKKERGQNTENGWEVEREIHNTYTTCPSDQERETDDKENRSKEEGQVRNGLFVRSGREEKQ